MVLDGVWLGGGKARVELRLLADPGLSKFPVWVAELQSVQALQSLHGVSPTVMMFPFCVCGVKRTGII